MSKVDADQFFSQFPVPVTIHAGRAKWLWNLLVSLLFVSVGVWDVSTGFWVGWLVVLFFGLGAIVSAVSLASGREN